MAAYGSLDPGYTIGGAITLLQASLPGKFNTLDAEYDDGITLDDVANENYSFALLDRFDKLPAIAFNAVTPYQQINQGGGFNMQTIRFEVHLLIASSETLTGTYYGITKTLHPREVSQIRLQRMLRGIVELFRDAPTLPVATVPQAYGLSIGAPNYYDFQTGIDDRAGRAGVIEIAAKIKQK